MRQALGKEITPEGKRGQFFKRLPDLGTICHLPKAMFTQQWPEPAGACLRALAERQRQMFLEASEFETLDLTPFEVAGHDRRDPLWVGERVHRLAPMFSRVWSSYFGPSGSVRIQPSKAGQLNRMLASLAGMAGVCRACWVRFRTAFWLAEAQADTVWRVNDRPLCEGDFCLDCMRKYQRLIAFGVGFWPWRMRLVCDCGAFRDFSLEYPLVRDFMRLERYFAAYAGRVIALITRQSTEVDPLSG